MGELNHFSDEGNCLLKLGDVIKGERIGEEGLYCILEAMPIGVRKIKVREGGCRRR